jgi:hypothetical protein
MTEGILIPGKVDGLPIPGIQISGHKIFIEIKETDNQDMIHEMCDILSRAFRVGAAMSKDIRVVKKHECDHMWPRPLKGL